MSETPTSTEPPPTLPRTARIASRLGTFAPVCAIVGVLLIHVGFIPPLGGFMFFQIALLCGLLALPFGLAAVVITRDDPENPGRTAGWLGMASGALMLTITIAGAGDGLGSPPINDITTNLDDPPQFADASLVPDFAGRDMNYPPEFVEVVRTHYPGLRTLEATLDRDEAFDRALSLASGLGWDVVWQDKAAGTIDARQSTAVFQFVDDVAIRIRSNGTGSFIDIRSKSRDGRGDLGANAARILAFARAFDQ